MLECAKTHLQQFRISKFSGEDPRNLLFKGRGGKGGQGERGEREGGRGRIGKGRDMGGKEGRNGVGRGGEGRGARHGLPLLETSSGSVPGLTGITMYGTRRPFL